jgi:serine protease Do
MSTRKTRLEPLSKSSSILGVLALLLLVAPLASGQRQPTTDSLDQLNEAIDALTKKVWPSVVQILVTSYGAREEGTRGDANVVVGRQHAMGSGFVIDADGYIMTNAHVVSGARRLEVVLPPPDVSGSLASALSARHRIVPARIIGIAREPTWRRKLTA